MSIALERSVGGFFHEVVEEAVRERQVDATEQATSYLVSLLTEFTHPDPVRENTFDKPLAFLLDEAFRTSGAERFQRLRALGDGVLYLSGFFGDHIETRGVDAGYVASVGVTAYRGAATMLGRPEADRKPRKAQTGAGDASESSDENVFAELSLKFDRFVEVLAVIAEITLAQQARGERGVLKLYERWLRSGSTTLAKELGARGIVPSRGTSGIH
jgi:hypothetical protein